MFLKDNPPLPMPVPIFRKDPEAPPRPPSAPSQEELKEWLAARKG